MTIKESEVVYFRFSTVTIKNVPVRLAFKAGNYVVGIYWGGDTDGWIPAKWTFPKGDFNLNGKKSDLDICLDDIKTVLE